MTIGCPKNILEESRPLFFVTGLVGLWPVKIRSTRIPGYFYVIFMLIGYFVLYAFTISNTMDIYGARKVYTKITKTREIQAMSSVLFVTITVVSSVLSSSTVRSIYVELNVIDERLNLLNVRFDYVLSMKKEMMHVFQAILVTSLFTLSEYWPEIGPDTDASYLLLLWFVNTWPQFVNSIAMTSYVVANNKIIKRFEAINKVIPDLLISDKNYVSTIELETNNLFRMRLLNRIHEKLFNAATNLNEKYSFMILTSFVVYFLTTCAHLRIVTQTFGDSTNYIDFSTELIWTIFYLGKFVYVIHACHSVTAEGKLSGRLLCEKYTDVDHHPLKNEMDAMARRVEGRVLQLTACNLFAIDYPTLKKIIVVFAAYVFFVYQFAANTPKNLDSV